MSETVVRSDLLAQRAVAALAVAAADLQHHHDEHGHVQQKHQAEVTDTGGVEDGLVHDPAAEEETGVSSAASQHCMAFYQIPHDDHNDTCSREQT